MSVTVKLLVEREDGVVEEHKWEADSFSIRQERGMQLTYKEGEVRPYDVQPNGQSRVALYLWSGCESWEAFVERSPDKMDPR